jgi:hypothetical protein
MNDELERIWKEVVLTYLLCPGTYLKGQKIKKTKRKISGMVAIILSMTETERLLNTWPECNRSRSVPFWDFGTSLCGRPKRDDIKIYSFVMIY